MNNTEYEVMPAEEEQALEPLAERKKWYQEVSLEEARSIIRENITSASRSFIAVGYYLKNVRDRELYVDGGYRTVWEFADAEYGISKSTTSRYMSMNDKFSQGGDSPYVANAYKDFSRSQLQEMLYLTDEQIELVTPETQVKLIRELRQPMPEIPYMDIPGQLNISDFPGVVPETSTVFQAPISSMPEEILQVGSMILTKEDFAEFEPDEIKQAESVAVSQQAEIYPEVERYEPEQFKQQETPLAAEYSEAEDTEQIRGGMVLRQAVLDLIVSSSGCDGSDDFARGWDEACRMLYEAVERMECPGSRTRIN